MDLRLYARVLWRHRLLVAGGFVLAVALAILSVVRVSPHGVTYRDSRLWAAPMQLQVTQTGSPEVRLYGTRDQGSTESPTPVSPGAVIVDPARFANLAILYSTLITSDAVKRLANHNDGIRAKIVATPERDPQSGVLLPFIDVVSIATAPRAAMTYAERTARALNAFILQRQRAANVPDSDRAIVVTTVHPRGASVYRSRPKTMPIVVFLAVMFATVGLAFILDNARRRPPDSGEGDVGARTELHGAEQRRSA
jgi:hypothetical protein